MEALEIYILCKERTSETVLFFLEKFMPINEESIEEYYFPQYSDNPNTIFDSYIDLIKILEKNTCESYSIYWENCKDEEIRNAMCFFTEDGGLIVGLVVESNIAIWMEKLSLAVKGEYGYISFDSPPPETIKDFKNNCKNSDYIYLFEGEVFNKNIDS